MMSQYWKAEIPSSKKVQETQIPKVELCTPNWSTVKPSENIFEEI